MSDVGTRTPRTAVLVVHGIGSQRALETMRGIIRAIWLDDDKQKSEKRIWNHPEKSGIDIDLAVITTSNVPETRDRRQVDFHELYWAHLMSETKAIAVLLWLFEIARKGPHLKPGMNGVWWFGSIFLCLLILSTVLIVLQTIIRLSELFIQEAPVILIAPFWILLCGVVFGFLVSCYYRAWRLAGWLGLVSLPGVVLVFAPFLAETLDLYAWLREAHADKLDPFVPFVIDFTIPVAIALLATYLLMGRPGLRAFWIVLAGSIVVFAIIFAYTRYDSEKNRKIICEKNPTIICEKNPTIIDVLWKGWRPWSLGSTWSAATAWVVIGIYVVMNAVFLQPYLGDAARYFRNSPANVAVRRKIRRQAVDMLDGLHSSGMYDRIIVVAHSLGCVIAYDMLRAYFSRICDQLPSPDEIGKVVDEVDNSSCDPFEKGDEAEKIAMRAKSREIIAAIAKLAEQRKSSGEKAQTWLVTDFITLGNALAHAKYLMCEGRKADELGDDFLRRVREREFPTCPPKKLDNDGLLSFRNPETGMREFHHGAVFGLTRWTNLYFLASEIVWGDAIGGPVASVFGSHIQDVPLTRHPDFFIHTAYWDVSGAEGRGAPHIAALRRAVNLADN